MKQKQHSAGRRERKFWARQKVLKEIKSASVLWKELSKDVLVTLMFSRPPQWLPCWLLCLEASPRTWHCFSHSISNHDGVGVEEGKLLDTPRCWPRQAALPQGLRKACGGRCWGETLLHQVRGEKTALCFLTTPSHKALCKAHCHCDLWVWSLDKDPMWSEPAHLHKGAWVGYNYNTSRLTCSNSPFSSASSSISGVVSSSRKGLVDDGGDSSFFY